jgi:hypothetical protein
MKGNFHVRFLGEEAAVMPVSLPDCQGEGGKTEFSQNRAPSQESDQLYYGPPVFTLL